MHMSGIQIADDGLRNERVAMGQEEEIERNMGVQPLDGIMTEHELGNHALVAASTEPMTHKAVQRARKGRRLTKHMKQRMADALNLLLKQKGVEIERPWVVKDLFTY
jgi:hypothetical protein